MWVHITEGNEGRAPHSSYNIMCNFCTTQPHTFKLYKIFYNCKTDTFKQNHQQTTPPVMNNVQHKFIKVQSSAWGQESTYDPNHVEEKKEREIVKPSLQSTVNYYISSNKYVEVWAIGRLTLRYVNLHAPTIGGRTRVTFCTFEL